MSVKNKEKGFSLTEILIVVAIIGILSSLILVSLSTARRKARDQKRKADLAAVQAALELYADKHGTYRVSGGGSGGNGQGWLTFSNGGSYPKSVVDVLEDEGFISANDIQDPTQGDQGYMIYLCDSYKIYALFATLENPTSDDIAYLASVCNGTSVRNNYGKNYAVTNRTL